MMEKTTNLSGCFSGNAISVRKKLIVLSVFFCMMINGFMPSTIEISRYSFVMVALTAVHTGMVTALKKCNDSLVVVAAKVCEEMNYIFGIPSGLENSKAGQDKGKSGSQGTNTSNDYAIFNKVKKEDKKSVSQKTDDEKSLYFVYKNSIYTMYSGCASPPVNAAGSGLILLFLVFIAAIRQRKGIDRSIRLINIKRNIWKTRISA